MRQLSGPRSPLPPSKGCFLPHHSSPSDSFDSSLALGSGLGPPGILLGTASGGPSLELPLSLSPDTQALYSASSIYSHPSLSFPMFPSPFCTALHRSRGGTLGHRATIPLAGPPSQGPNHLRDTPFSGVGSGVSGPPRIITSSEPLKHKPWQITELLLSLPPLDTACLWSPPASPRQLCRLRTATPAPSSHMLQS